MLLWTTLAAVSTLEAGCALFQKSPGLISARAFKLPTLGLPPDAIELDVLYVTRPIGDARLGDELWRHVDQVAAVQPAQRAVLRATGTRVGVVGSTPPHALQQMLHAQADFVYEPSAEQAKQLTAQHCVLRSGAHTEIQVSPFYESCSLAMEQSGEPKLRYFENAQCKYWVTATRLQDGWVQLDFVPQIHYGEFRLRHGVEDAEWQYHSAQQKETMFPQKFSVRLAVGEMVLLTAAEDADDTIGRLFFLGADDRPQAQRLLVLRVTNVRNPEQPDTP